MRGYITVKMFVCLSYTIKELDQRVPGVKPCQITRFRWRANRTCRKLNKYRQAETYRYEVCDRLNGRWAVVAMQNVAVPDDED